MGKRGSSSSEDVEAPLLALPADDGRERPPAAAWARPLLAHGYPAVASGPAACAAVCALVDLGGAHRGARNMLAVLAWVFLWWVTGAVPLAVASMAPLFLFPLFGVAGADAVAKAYMDDVISLVLGSFILALAIEHYQIHRRLALNVRAAAAALPLPFLAAAISVRDRLIRDCITDTLPARRSRRCSAGTRCGRRCCCWASPAPPSSSACGSTTRRARS
jgi:solute carrier family 13 (sodium-dependent dicarboxylate transporter), member 2/3/5